MTEITWAATRTKNTYRRTQYRKLAGHRGKKRALVAVANSLLQAVWHMLSDHQTYKELGRNTCSGSIRSTWSVR
jgi:transposase